MILAAILARINQSKNKKNKCVGGQSDLEQSDEDENILLLDKKH